MMRTSDGEEMEIPLDKLENGLQLVCHPPFLGGLQTITLIIQLTDSFMMHSFQDLEVRIF